MTATDGRAYLRPLFIRRVHASPVSFVVDLLAAAAAVVLASMRFGDEPSAVRLDDRLHDVEEAFRRFAGAQAGEHIESARSEVMPLGAQYRRAAYVRALTERLPLPEGRAAFRAAVDAPRRDPGASRE